MLIKLGNIWVDPEKVMCLEPCQSTPTTLIWLPGTPDDCVGADIPIDEAAEAINRALIRPPDTGKAIEPPPDMGQVIMPPLLSGETASLLRTAYEDGWIVWDTTAFGFTKLFEFAPLHVGGVDWRATRGKGCIMQLPELSGYTAMANQPVSIAWLLGIKEGGGDE